MNRFLWLVLILAAALCGLTQPGLAQPVKCDAIKASADAPRELAEFDFLIGQHDVTLHAWMGNNWTPPRPTNAQWRGWYGLDGLAIYDEWTDPEVTRGSIGINVRLYDDREQIWKMMWINSANRQVQDLRAKVTDGILTMWQVYPERKGWKAEFEVIDESRWARNSYVPDEAGVWQPEFRLVATRTSCDV